LGKIMKTTLIMHNMILENEHGQQFSYVYRCMGRRIRLKRTDESYNPVVSPDVPRDWELWHAFLTPRWFDLEALEDTWQQVIFFVKIINLMVVLWWTMLFIWTCNLYLNLFIYCLYCDELINVLDCNNYFNYIWCVS
jgi:hypothetical protein